MTEAALIDARAIGYAYRPRRRWPFPRPPARAAVQDVNLGLHAGRTLALIGESGSGKTTLGRIIAGQLPVHQGMLRRAAGAGGAKALARSVQYVAQNPLDALDPKIPIRDQVIEALDIHRIGARASRPNRANALLEEVGLGAALAAARPGELSGGQAQRAVLARALALSPQVLVLDEPLSALDVSMQAHILTLLKWLQGRRGMAYLLVTHDLRVVPAMAHEVMVLFDGRAVEHGPADAVLGAPRHPYTQALVAAVPEIGDPIGWPALAPARGAAEGGCAYRHRCPRATARCGDEAPTLRVRGRIKVACHLTDSGTGAEVACPTS